MITVTMMVLLTLLSVGLLALSSITLRSSSLSQADEVARANARLALVMALAELQEATGDDRRVTANASLDESASQPHLVGVWESWSPKRAANPSMTGSINYASIKDERFLRWLASSTDREARFDRAWANTAPADSVALFDPESDGFELLGSRIPVDGGAFAWAVSQENTKAKINVAGPETPQRDRNDDLQAQARPSLAASASFEQPENDWNGRASRVLTLAQASLDPELSAGATPYAALAASASYTAHSYGLLTNVVDGGLRADMNLGFEMSDSAFQQDRWGDVVNPFRATAVTDFNVPATYRGQRPLFRPLVDSATIRTEVNYSPIVLRQSMNAASVPTFDTLRSHYRIPYHLYNPANPTAFMRSSAHIAAERKAGSADGTATRPSIMPVLNRMLFLMSAWIDPAGRPHLVLTPIITLWNPHNVALEMDGAVAYAWMDFPIFLQWNIFGTTGGRRDNGMAFSQNVGHGRDHAGHGRQVSPYFFFHMTAAGDNRLNTPIRMEAGEVRVFAPAAQELQIFNRLGNDQQRSLRMRPVDNVNQLGTRGGLALPAFQSLVGDRPDFRMQTGERAEIQLRYERSPYHYFVSLEDSGRIRGLAEGNVISEVQMAPGSLNRVSTPRTYPFSDLQSRPQPLAILETYHRVAVDSTTQVVDLVHTVNPRQPRVNRFLSGGTGAQSFSAGPHYESDMREFASFDGAIQTTEDGRRAFYGASNARATGRSELAFFEIPRSPLLSLAAFQHADLSASAYGPAYQVGNAWASPYLNRSSTARTVNSGPAGERLTPSLPIYDVAYLANETLWDAFFFSGAAPTIQPGSVANPANAWNAPIANVTRSHEQVLTDFVRNPHSSPLRNPRMRLHRGGVPEEDLISRLLEPAGAARIAAHLMVDGAFNINSTDEAAWIAVLSGLRGSDFVVEGGSASSNSDTPFPRLRNPRRGDEDLWDGFRSLSDEEIRLLAGEIVSEVRTRGPFLSLAEFVNRQPSTTTQSFAGTIQAAIDRTPINTAALFQNLNLTQYPFGVNVRVPRTGVGIPGFLTQADVLHSLAPVIANRSDTFVVRGYGEARDASGRVIARSWCQAVVQRVPEFVDPADSPETEIDQLLPVNRTFGRRYEIVSFEYLAPSRFDAAS